MGILETSRPSYRSVMYKMPLGMMTRRSLAILTIITIVLILFFSSQKGLESPPEYHGHHLGQAPPIFGPPGGQVAKDHPSYSYDDPIHHVDPQSGPEHQGGPAPEPEAAPSRQRDAFDSLGNFTESDRPVMAKDPLCANFPDTSKIAIVMKTGATESFGKIPTQLMTAMRCVEDVVIFSDKEETIAGVHIRDALDNVLPDAVTDNQEFDLYWDQKNCDVDQGACTKGHDKAKEGWKLDKYKNIHMAEKVWKLRPGRDWYIFIDADTYLLWNTLILWLNQLDANRKHFLGSVALIHGFSFGHGGSGYIVSRPAMSELLDKNDAVAHFYDADMINNCCGDYMFAKAMKEKAELDVVQVWPTLNGERFWTMPFGPTHWCHPIATMHHMSAEETSRFWEWETKRYASESERTKPSPVLLRDIYHAFFDDRLMKYRDDWDNISDDVYYLNATDGKHADWQINKAKKSHLSEYEEEAHLSFEHCQRACEHRDDCFQYRFQDGICGISWAFKMGFPVKAQDKKTKSKPRSGWDVNKISAWIADQDCSKVHWPIEKGLP